ncbi:FHA domain-containing protein [Cellulosimicrobium sp. CUA-896]|uniref:FHA domain-containing protein n=1 Tax=Cellulosimicrobium sp. CUA-896 TaxID=1517881 RepID=UPI000B33CDF8|nr:FHA domain-containing protein [Cellulosimicrobium sp. CUA-896]
MRLKATLHRPEGTQDDIVVTADAGATIGEIAGTIARVDPRGPAAPDRPLTLLAQLPGQERPAALPPDAALGEAWIGSGAVVAVVDRELPGFDAPRAGHVRAAVRVEGQPVHELSEGSYVVGRSPECDVVLDDPLVSKRHLRVDVGDTVDVVDLGSANGLVVDGGHVSRVRVEGRSGCSSATRRSSSSGVPTGS